MEKQIKVYKWIEIDKSNGVIRALKDGVSFEEYQAGLRSRGKDAIIIKPVSMKTIMKWDFNGTGKAVDGCTGIETDGTCQHGFPSYAKAKGIV